MKLSPEVLMAVQCFEQCGRLFHNTVYVQLKKVNSEQHELCKTANGAVGNV
jgi:hypothetical protein